MGRVVLVAEVADVNVEPSKHGGELLLRVAQVVDQHLLSGLSKLGQERNMVSEGGVEVRLGSWRRHKASNS